MAIILADLAALGALGDLGALGGVVVCLFIDLM